MRARGTGHIHHDGHIVRQINGKVIYEHRLVWEQHYGKIPDGMVIHHINGDKLDNRIENLIMLDDDAHRRVHAGYKFIDNKEMKLCPICNELKPLNEFYIRPSGRISWCLKCKKEYEKIYKQSRKQQIKSQNNTTLEQIGVI